MDEMTIFKTLDDEIIIETQSVCLRDIIPKEFIDAGSTGYVNKACMGLDCNYVIKIIDLEDNTDERISQEVALTKIASKLGIGPKYIEDFRCRVTKTEGTDLPTGTDMHFIMTEKLDINIGDFIETYLSKTTEQQLIEKLTILMMKCYDYMFLHGDLYYKKPNEINEGNIMLNLDENNTPTEAFLIDFEDSQVVNVTKEQIKNEWCNYMRILRESYDITKQLTKIELDMCSKNV